MISTLNLTFSYNKQQHFRFPDLHCASSQTLLVTGGSGKGKTTLLHLLGGLLRPESGEILFDGTSISGFSEKKLDHFRGKNIGKVLQQSYFIASLSVLENVELASWLATGRKASARAIEILSQLGLSDQINKHPSQLSVGQQQRVSIARALINQPKVLLADEPTSSLDDENADNVSGLLSQLAADFQTSLIIVTHDQRLKQRFDNTIEL